MSLQSAIEFTTAAVKDPALAAEISRVTNGKSPERAAEAFVEIGKGKGYGFTTAEATKVRLGITQAASKLSEAELDKVAGGAGSNNNLSLVLNQQVLTTVFKPIFGEFLPGPAGGMVAAGAGAAISTAASGGSTQDCILAFGNAVQDAGQTTWNTIASVFSGW